MCGVKTTVNFSELRNNVAVSDAFVVNASRDAGAVILGKTNIPTMLSDQQSFGPRVSDGQQSVQTARELPAAVPVAGQQGSPPASRAWRSAATSAGRFECHRISAASLA